MHEPGNNSFDHRGDRVHRRGNGRGVPGARAPRAGAGPPRGRPVEATPGTGGRGGVRRFPRPRCHSCGGAGGPACVFLLPHPPRDHPGDGLLRPGREGGRHRRRGEHVAGLRPRGRQEPRHGRPLVGGAGLRLVRPHRRPPAADALRRVAAGARADDPRWAASRAVRHRPARTDCGRGPGPRDRRYPRRSRFSPRQGLPAVRACRVHPQGNRADPEPRAGQGRPVQAGEPRDDASDPDLGRPEASRRAFRQGLVRRVRAEARGSHRGVLPHPASAGSRHRSPEWCLCRHERRGQEDRRTPADDARGVHHQAPSGPRLTTRENNMGKFEGKTALITGGNGGIGFATAKQFVKEGAYVFITGRREPETAAAAEEIGSNVTGVQGDVSNLGDLDRLFAQIKREKGRLDIVFANAGVAKLAPLGTITEELYDSIFNINVKGVLFTVQKAPPLLDGASIILNASIGASKGPPANSVNCATKAAVRSFARTLTTDLKDRRIRVNAVSPGVIDTPGLEDVMASSETGRQLGQMISGAAPLGRFGTPDEIARAVVFLASDDSSYITGTELSVDGGFAQV